VTSKKDYVLLIFCDSLQSDDTNTMAKAMKIRFPYLFRYSTESTLFASPAVHH